MRRSLLLLPSCACMLLAAGVALADASKTSDHNRFKWRDAAGNLHYGDSLPPEAARLGYDVVSPQGIVIRHVDRMKTPEELAAAKAAAARDRAARDEDERRGRLDTQLLAAYPTEGDLARSQRQQLEMLDQQVHGAEVVQRQQEEALADGLARAAEVERSGKPLPPALASEIADLQHRVDEQRQLVERRRNERKQAATAAEAQRARYRELKAPTPENPSQP